MFSRLFALFVCLFVCASTLIACAIIISRALFPCDYTLIDFMAALSTGVATMSTVLALIIGTF